MLQMHANSREDIDEAFAGDIVALAGLKETTTGDTLCDPLKPVILERMEFPEPVIQIAIEPKTKGDQEKMGLALNRLAAEDPSFRVKTDEESGQTIIAGMGELHLDIIVDRMRREFKVEANVGAPQVAYRETITRRHEKDYTHKKQTGGTGQFARVKIVFEPNPEGEDFKFESEDRRRRGSEGIHSRRPEGHRERHEHRPAGRLPDARRQGDADRRRLPRRRLLGPGLRNRRSRAAFREAAREAGAQLLEPIMKVEVVTPEDYVGDVIGDLNSPSWPDPGPGNARHRNVVINAHVPLANMFKYVDTLRSMSARAAPSTPCSSTTTRRCRMRSPRKSRPSTPADP